MHSPVSERKFTIATYFLYIRYNFELHPITPTFESGCPNKHAVNILMKNIYLQIAPSQSTNNTVEQQNINRRYKKQLGQVMTTSKEQLLSI